MQIYAHLNFKGQCEEAFRFYEKALGGEIAVLSRYADTPMAGQLPAEWRQKIVHGRIAIAGTTLMGADPPPDRYNTPQGITIALSTANSADAERCFKALSENGTVGVPMTETFFAHRFGMVVDRFGIPWMVIHQK